MIKIGILGAGRVTQNRYVDVFQNEIRRAAVTVVADPVRERADKVAAELSARAVYGDQALLNDADVDVILICSESGNHYQHALQALEGGKHVIVEKPPAMLPEQVIEARDLAAKKGLMYACIFQNRYNPAMKALKAAMDKGRFGKLVLATIRLRWCRYQDYYEDGWHGTWAMDGGVINQQAIHHVDALEWVCGPVAEVCAAQAAVLNDLEAEDTHVAAVRFQNGALGVMEATTAARPEDFEASISVVGEKGYASIGGIALNRVDTWQFTETAPEDETIPANCSQEVPTGYGLSHGPLLQEIVDRLAQGRIDPPITADDALPTVRLVHALYRSGETGSWACVGDNCISTRLGRKKCGE